MDCVLADYRFHAIQIAGHNPDDFPHISWTMDEVFPNKNVRWKIITDYGRRKFFAELPEYPWTQEVVRAALRTGDIRFLTGVGRSEDERGKRDWLEEHFPDIKNIADLLCTVRPGQEKSAWLLPGDVLVDDLDKNVLGWIEAGGQALWFPGVETASARRHANWYVMEGSFERDLAETVNIAQALCQPGMVREFVTRVNM